MATDAGADIVGGEELVPKVLSKEVKNFDFCVSTPDMMPELVPLKRLLRKRFPNSKRGKQHVHCTRYSVTGQFIC